MAMSANKVLVEFLERYGETEAPQSPSRAETDTQLHSVAMVIASELAKSRVGTLLDVGAGRGTLLSRLISTESFVASEWQYLAVEVEEHHDELMGLAWKRKLHRRFDAISLDEFYSEHFEPRAGPVFVVVRNVLHELNVERAAALLKKVTGALSDSADALLIQDLSVFPAAEKGNACWDSDLLRQILESAGFAVTTTAHKSRSGNRWFNALVTRSEESHGEVDWLPLVRDARIKQWSRLREAAGAPRSESALRDSRVALLDLDLQFGALTLQLLDAGAAIAPLTRRQRQRVAKGTLEAVLRAADLSKVGDVDIGTIRYFKDRANSQAALEKFLIQGSTVAAVAGGPLMGKTALVRHVLANFRHGRVVVQIDAQSSSSVWSLVESFLAEMTLRVPPQVLGRLEHATAELLHAAVSESIETWSRPWVLVVDHFERLLAPDGSLADREIARLFRLLASLAGAKLILTTRKQPRKDCIPDVDIDLEHPPVGRFPRAGHVQNLLGHFVARTEFSEELLTAIDRHPYMAFLAGLIIQEDEELSDPDVLEALSRQLRADLLHKVATSGAEAALQWLSLTRGAVPRSALEEVAGKAQVVEALASGLAYLLPSRVGEDRVGCIGAIRIHSNQRVGSDGRVTDDVASYHRRWATAYRRAYSGDDDPRWVREAYYHTAVTEDVAGLERFGRQYRGEIQDAGEYWFRSAKDFESALWAFQKVFEYSEEADPHIRMRLGSCRVRTGDSGGLGLFLELFEEYPEWIGARRSYVDCLLFLERYAEAIDFLVGFAPLESVKDGWIVGQYGRAYLGLHRYTDAVGALQRRQKMGFDSYTAVQLARAYRRLGRRADEGRTLKRAYRGADSGRVAQAYASWLSSNQRAAEAVDILLDRVAADPLNGWLGFAYVRALLGCGQVGQAENYVVESGRFSWPSFLRKPMQAFVASAKGEFERAVSLLDAALKEATGRDESLLGGQLCETYIAWAEAVPNSAGRASVAVQGLKAMGVSSHNLPLNVSIAKLALIAGDREKVGMALTTSMGINPNSPDVLRLKKRAAEILP